LNIVSFTPSNTLKDYVILPDIMIFFESNFVGSKIPCTLHSR
jgi:hypothetical protein